MNWNNFIFDINIDPDPTPRPNTSDLFERIREMEDQIRKEGISKNMLRSRKVYFSIADPIEFRNFAIITSDQGTYKAPIYDNSGTLIQI